ncbi:MAG: hypothetical protein V1877_02420 [Candidatus Tagabacteria bacterium]
MKYKNTLQKGSVRYIVFKEAGKWYAVALEFNIIEEGDDPREALFSLFEAIQGYIKSAIKIKSRPQILNQKAEKEYEDLWDTLQEKRESKAVKKSIPPIYTFGERALATV